MHGDRKLRLSSLLQLEEMKMRFEEETSCYLTGRGLFSLSTRLLKSTTRRKIKQWILLDII
jgi:hypothetical protein